MRESIGTTFTLNFILLFIFLVFAFLGGTLSYYKAYRVNNHIIHALEVYEGYNEYSEEAIGIALGNLGYDISQNLGCSPTRENTSRDKFASEDATHFGKYNKPGELRLPASGVQQGYCVYYYEYDNSSINAGGGDVAKTDIYYSYGVLTYMKMRFPVVEYALRIPIFSRTNRMYDFGCSRGGSNCVP